MIRMMPENIGGLDKLYPCGPVCTVNGKECKTFVGCTPKGGITSKLLVEMLKQIDRSGMYKKDDELVLLLDGHGT